mgnify:CR=1 FL=1
MGPAPASGAVRVRRPVALARQPTGIAGLDAILRGGLPVGSAYLVAGTPGTGKTTLGNQLAYNHAAQGKIAVIATLVAETHDRMLAHLAGFTFLDADSIGTSVHYLSLVSALEEGGLDGVLTVIRDIVRRLGATLLVVDGTGLLEDLAPSTLDFRRFTAQLQVQSALLGCTTLLLTNRRPEQTDEIATHVDGVIHLVQESVGARDALSILLTQRTADLPSHAGQIAFPGGKVDPEDDGPLGAALREASEEIGLDPALVEPLGFLDPYRTVTGFAVTPVLALVSPEFHLTLNTREVADAFEVPFAFLMDANNHEMHTRVYRGHERKYYAMPYGERYIWGATAGILVNMHRRLFQP